MLVVQLLFFFICFGRRLDTVRLKSFNVVNWESFSDFICIAQKTWCLVWAFASFDTCICSSDFVISSFKLFESTCGLSWNLFQNVPLLNRSDWPFDWEFFEVQDILRAWHAYESWVSMLKGSLKFWSPFISSGVHIMWLGKSDLSP